MILVLVGALIGLGLLRYGLDTDGSNADASNGGTEDTTPTTGPDDTTDTSDTTVPVTQPARPPEQVQVVVANATDPGVNRAAARAKDTLQAIGYVVIEAVNAPDEVAAARVASAFLYDAGYEAEAIEVALALGGTAELVEPFSEPLPLESKGAAVLVLLSNDLARAG